MKKLNKQDLIDLVNKIINVEFYTEQEGDKLIDLFERNVPHPEVVTLIYHHKPELTAEEIVEKALSYKPIIMHDLTSTEKNKKK